MSLLEYVSFYRIFDVIKNGKLFYTNVVGDEYCRTYSNWKYIASVLSEFRFVEKFLTSLSSSFFVHALAACIVHFTSAML